MLNPAPPPAPTPAPADELRLRAIDALAKLLDLYLATQPRDLRRQILTAGRAVGWHLDRRLAADLVGQLSDETLRVVVAALYDWSTAALEHDDETIDVDLADAGVQARARAELGAALSRVSW